MRVAVVAEWYPSPADPVHGIWAHRQAVAAREAGAEVRVLAQRRPVPPLSALRALAGSPADTAPLRAWTRGVGSTLRPWTLDGIAVAPVPFVAPPRPWSYGGWGWWMAPPLALALARLRRRWPFDVVHVHNVVPGGHAAALALGHRPRERGAAGERPALVVSTHGPDVIRVPERGPAARRALAAALGAADLLVANSGWARRRCEELGPPGLATRVVHLGADVPSAAPPKRPRPTLVTVAHLQARKRHAEVLRAIAALRGSLDLDYLVVGDGETRRPLEALARELGVADRVRFAGQLDHDQALAAAWSCHLMVMPSVEEPFGVAYVEAMAGGVPAIGTRGEGGPEDIAAAGDGMLLVPPGDREALVTAIAETFRTPGRLEALGAAARETVSRNFTWTRCGEATVDAYREAIARSRDQAMHAFRPDTGVHRRDADDARI